MTNATTERRQLRVGAICSPELGHSRHLAQPDISGRPRSRAAQFLIGDSRKKYARHGENVKNIPVAAVFTLRHAIFARLPRYYWLENR